MGISDRKQTRLEMPVKFCSISFAAMEEGETSSRSFVQGGGPLCGLSVPGVISLQLKALAQQDSKYLEACSQSLSQAQVQAVREACFA